MDCTSASSGRYLQVCAVEVDGHSTPHDPSDMPEVPAAMLRNQV